MPPHPLNNFQIQSCYRNEPRFNGVYSRDNLTTTTTTTTTATTTINQRMGNKQ